MAMSDGARGSLRALKDALARQARQEGFVAFGVARATALTTEASQLRRWLALGRHGEMRYMRAHAAVRADPRHPGMLPTARSVVMLAWPYAERGRLERNCSDKAARIARYAQGRDYHRVLNKALRRLSASLRDAGYEARAGTDSLPIFERAWAQRAGIGFVGKNACLIVPGVGSHVFLAGLVTSARLPADTPMRGRCGRCTRCLTACPTRALRAPGELDARRCVPYHTIESRKLVPASLATQWGAWLFGCDDCQDICPYNHGRPHGHRGALQPFSSEARATELPSVEALLTLPEATLLERLEGSPLRRPGVPALRRNALIAISNGMSPTQRHDWLAQQAVSHPEALVRAQAKALLDHGRRRLPVVGPELRGLAST